MVWIGVFQRESNLSKIIIKVICHVFCFVIVI